MSTDTEHAELIHGITSLAELLDMGPIEQVEILDGPTDGPDEIAWIRLEPTGHLGATMQSWAQYLRLMDATTGSYNKADPWVRLHLRGWMSEETAVIVTAPWPRTSPQVRLMVSQIERQRIHELVGQLARLDPDQN